MTNPPWTGRGPDDPEPGRDDADIDAAFAAIVAGWDLEAHPDRPGWEAKPARTDPADPTGPTGPLGAPGRPGRADEPGAARAAAPGGPTAGGPDDGHEDGHDDGADGEHDDGRVAEGSSAVRGFVVAPEGWRVHVPPDDDLEDDTFTPPDPPLPRGGRFWAALAGLVIGPLIFIVWALTGPHSTTLPYLLAALATLAGFAALISQLPEQHDEDDDGARV